MAFSPWPATGGAKQREAHQHCVVCSHSSATAVHPGAHTKKSAVQHKERLAHGHMIKDTPRSKMTGGVAHPGCGKSMPGTEVAR